MWGTGLRVLGVGHWFGSAGCGALVWECCTGLRVLGVGHWFGSAAALV